MAPVRLKPIQYQALAALTMEIANKEFTAGRVIIRSPLKQLVCRPSRFNFMRDFSIIEGSIQ